ncbi:hypothetical protein [Flavisolibacter ginsengisoli]|jgi:hypothetical protein|nr:hypothetical protein [Flavisolibacter ginsengisoli]
MVTKINRDNCLKEFSNFPLRHYDEATDEEEYFYPAVFATQWLKVASNDKIESTELLASELTKLMKQLCYSKLIILGDTEQSWVSKLSLERNDYEPLIEALRYLAYNNIDTYFNGGLQVSDTDLYEFLKHFYCLTSCDASLPYFHFMDIDQNFIGFIHYSGEMRIDTMNKGTQLLLERAIKQTRFIKVLQRAK